MTQKSAEFSQSRAMLDEVYDTVNSATSKLSSGDQRSQTAEGHFGQSAGQAGPPDPQTV